MEVALPVKEGVMEMITDDALSCVEVSKIVVLISVMLLTTVALGVGVGVGVRAVVLVAAAVELAKAEGDGVTDKETELATELMTGVSLRTGLIPEPEPNISSGVGVGVADKMVEVKLVAEGVIILSIDDVNSIVDDVFPATIVPEIATCVEDTFSSSTELVAVGVADKIAEVKLVAEGVISILSIDDVNSIVDDVFSATTVLEIAACVEDTFTSSTELVAIGVADKIAEVKLVAEGVISILSVDDVNSIVDDVFPATIVVEIAACVEDTFSSSTELVAVGVIRTVEVETDGVIIKLSMEDVATGVSLKIGLIPEPEPSSGVGVGVADKNVAVKLVAEGVINIFSIDDVNSIVDDVFPATIVLEIAACVEDTFSSSTELVAIGVADKIAEVKLVAEGVINILSIDDVNSIVDDVFPATTVLEIAACVEDTFTSSTELVAIGVADKIAEVKLVAEGVINILSIDDVNSIVDDVFPATTVLEIAACVEDTFTSSTELVAIGVADKIAEVKLVAEGVINILSIDDVNSIVDDVFPATTVLEIASCVEDTFTISTELVAIGVIRTVEVETIDGVIIKLSMEDVATGVSLKIGLISKPEPSSGVGVGVADKNVEVKLVAEGVINILSIDDVNSIVDEFPATIVLEIAACVEDTFFSSTELVAIGVADKNVEVKLVAEGVIKILSIDDVNSIVDEFPATIVLEIAACVEDTFSSSTELVAIGVADKNVEVKLVAEGMIKILSIDDVNSIVDEFPATIVLEIAACVEDTFSSSTELVAIGVADKNVEVKLVAEGMIKILSIDDVNSIVDEFPATIVLEIAACVEDTFSSSTELVAIGVTDKNVEVKLVAEGVIKILSIDDVNSIVDEFPATIVVEIAACVEDTFTISTELVAIGVADKNVEVKLVAEGVIKILSVDDVNSIVDDVFPATIVLEIAACVEDTFSSSTELVAIGVADKNVEVKLIAEGVINILSIDDVNSIVDEFPATIVLEIAACVEDTFSSSTELVAVGVTDKMLEVKLVAEGVINILSIDDVNSIVDEFSATIVLEMAA